MLIHVLKLFEIGDSFCLGYEVFLEKQFRIF